MRISKAGTSNEGFTFIELAVVLLIIGIVAVVAFPRVSNLAESDLKRAARHLSSTIQFANDRATVTRSHIRLNFDLEKQTYWFSTPEDPDEEGKKAEEESRQWRLSESLRFEDIVVPFRGKVSDGTAVTQFYPSGRIDRTILHLEDEVRREKMTIIINPVTGRVRIHDDYREDAISKG